MSAFALDDLRVLELTDHRGEFLGRLLAGFGADVIKVEPPAGSDSRTLGPFYQDSGDPEQSLFFWHYNYAKRGVTLDLETSEGRAALRALLPHADVLLESHPLGYLASLGLGYDDIREDHPALIYCSLSDFGQDGPWSQYVGSDLVLLAMGGPTSHSGYARDPETGVHPTPPMTPGPWHSLHFAGAVTMLNLLGAIHYRDRHGAGQYIDASIHEAVANGNEFHTSNYLADRSFRGRQPQAPAPQARDGRHVMPFHAGRKGYQELLDFILLDRDVDEPGIAEPLLDPRFDDDTFLLSPQGQAVMHDVTARYVAEYDSEDLFQRAQAKGLTWSPLRAPEDNLSDPHYVERGNFTEVEFPEVGATLTDAARGWVAEHLDWRTSPRAPRLGEHNDEVAEQFGIDWPQG